MMCGSIATGGVSTPSPHVRPIGLEQVALTLGTPLVVVPRERPPAIRVSPADGPPRLWIEKQVARAVDQEPPGRGRRGSHAAILTRRTEAMGTAAQSTRSTLPIR